MSRYERIRVLSQIGLYCVIVMYWIKTNHYGATQDALTG